MENIEPQPIDENNSEIDNNLVQTILNEIKAVKQKEEDVNEMPKVPSQINSNYLPNQMPVNPLHMQAAQQMQYPFNPMQEQYQQMTPEHYNSHLINLINNDNQIINRFLKNVTDMSLFTILLIIFSYVSKNIATNIPMFSTEAEKTINLAGIILTSFVTSLFYMTIKKLI